MRIRSIRLRNYKRFTDLTIADLPDTARLVVLVGPNGTGKSSVFDSFLLKARVAVGNDHLAGDTEEYYDKMSTTSAWTSEVANRVEIEIHGIDAGQVDWKSVFRVRSAYRNEADFRIEQLGRPKDGARPHIRRIIDGDVSVSSNYEEMVWKRLRDVDQDALKETTMGDYREESLRDLQKAMRGLFSNPDLFLHDFGGSQELSFRFAKGNAVDFHYKNLSGGEKAAFDVLLDVFVKRDEAKEAVFCIDEPELHVATALQGPLIASALNLLREPSQLWVATHSIGIVREAYRMWQDRPERVVFLDFSGWDFDAPVTMAPSAPNRKFWANMYEVALDDLSALVAPRLVVICEGSKSQPRAFDARCYNRLFAEEAPETLFVSGGGSSEVIQSEQLVTILKAIASGIEVEKLIDRDDMTEEARSKEIDQGVRVLRRREIEDYLYDPEVLRTFLEGAGCDALVVEEVLKKRELLVRDQRGPQNIKDVSRELLQVIREATELPNLGNNREEFALQFLVPALQKTRQIFEELREDVFGEDWRRSQDERV